MEVLLVVVQGWPRPAAFQMTTMRMLGQLAPSRSQPRVGVGVRLGSAVAVGVGAHLGLAAAAAVDADVDAQLRQRLLTQSRRPRRLRCRAAVLVLGNEKPRPAFQPRQRNAARKVQHGIGCLLEMTRTMIRNRACMR